MHGDNAVRSTVIDKEISELEAASLTGMPFCLRISNAWNCLIYRLRFCPPVCLETGVTLLRVWKPRLWEPVPEIGYYRLVCFNSGL